MAVEILYDLRQQQACLYDTSSDWAFGPIFGGEGAKADAEAFLAWFGGGAAYLARNETTVMARGPAIFTDGRDPRDWPETDLERLYVWWRAARDRTQVPA